VCYSTAPKRIWRTLLMATKMQKHSTRLVFPVALLTVLMLGFTYNYSGICMARSGWLSDREKLEAVFNELNRPGTGTDLKKQKYVILPYSSLDEYLSIHPDCCRARTELKDKPDLWTRITGRAAYSGIIFKHVVRHRYQDGAIIFRDDNNRQDMWLSACGHPYYPER
jgi:hypothetical protein